MAVVESFQDPYLLTLDLSTSENIKLYNKAIVGLSESEKYDLTISKWNDFYQKLEDDVSTLGLKAAVFIMTSRETLHATTELKDDILSYQSTTKVMVDLHCEILWTENSGSGLVWHPTENMQQD